MILCLGLVLDVSGSSTGTQAEQNGQKETKIILNGTDRGVSLQGPCVEYVSSAAADFYFNKGKIICLNGTKMNGIPAGSADSALLSQVLSSEQLGYGMDAREDTVYIFISPRGYFGVLVLAQIDVSKNIYSGTVISSSLDNALKQQIVETSQKNSGSTGMDTVSTGGMDTISTGGMDTISTGGMDTISAGGMDTIKTGGYDYFDTEISSNISKVIFEGKQVSFKLSPRKYSDGEVLVLLKDAASLLGITVKSNTESGLEKAVLTKGSKTVSVQAYSDKALVGTVTVKLTRAPKMDGKGILVPLSFLSKNFGLHYVTSDDNKVLTLSRKSIIEWKYAGYNNKKPYAEYESMYVDGVKTAKTRMNGKNHIFKNITLYNKKTGQTKVVLENKADLYQKEWSATPPTAKNSAKAGSTGKTANTSSSINSFFTRMNTHRFFQSSTFNTWGGQMIRRIAP